jgi:hypothetical protein
MTPNRQVIMTRTIQSRLYLFPIVFAAAAGCAKQANTNPEFALSKAREGLPAEARATGTSPRTSGDTLVCERSRRFSTPEGARWLWVRILVERQPGSDTENTLAETVVSTDQNGNQYDQKVELAGVSLDREADWTLRNTTGVRTGDARKSPKQAHRARGYTVGPNMGPFEISCGR